MAEFTADDVAANAAKPASASVTPTSTSATQHNLRDQIEAAKFKKAEDAAAGIEAGLWPLGGPFIVNPPGAF